MAFYLRFSLIVIIALLTFPIATAQTQTTDPLVQVLVSKGVLTTEEARLITNNASASEQRDRLAALLRDKGVISSAEFEAVRATAAPPELKTITADYKTAAPNSGAAAPQPSPPTVIAAVAPVRLLGIDTPKREGLIPDIKLGTGARLKLYGIFKTSIIHDSSSPQGNDFPLPLLAADTGPNNSPEFHLRARGLRLGANFEWLDPAPKLTLDSMTKRRRLRFSARIGRRLFLLRCRTRSRIQTLAASGMARLTRASRKRALGSITSSAARALCNSDLRSPLSCRPSETCQRMLPTS